MENNSRSAIFRIAPARIGSTKKMEHPIVGQSLIRIKTIRLGAIDLSEELQRNA